MIELNNDIKWLESKLHGEMDDVVSVGGLIPYLRRAHEAAQRTQSSTDVPPATDAIDIRNNVPVYVQIENQVRLAIASGQFKPGDKLPSVKELSERLNVNTGPVAKAYRDLELTGYIRSRRGVGVFVNQGVESKCRNVCRKQITDRLHEVITDAKVAGMSSQEIKELCAKLVIAAPHVP